MDELIGIEQVVFDELWRRATKMQIVVPEESKDGLVAELVAQLKSIVAERARELAENSAEHGVEFLGPSGYQTCFCRDCGELAVGWPGIFCHECVEAGCPDYQGQKGMSQECRAPHTYCDGDEIEGKDGEAYCSECGQPF